MTSVSVIVPCYNEAFRLEPQRFQEAVAKYQWLQLWFVDDGSTDTTRSALEQLAAADPDRLQVIALDQNRGKCEAVRAGVLAALATGVPYDLVGYLDADLVTPIEEIERLAAVVLAEPQIDVVLGMRIAKMGNDIKRKPSRHYLGGMFATAVSLMLRLPIHDTQCGCKLVRATAAKELFDKEFESRWLFDVEIIARLIKQHGHAGARQRLYELDLNCWHDIAGTKVRLRDFIQAPLHLWRIKRVYAL